MTKGGDFCPVGLDGGDLEGGWRREAVDGYPGHGRVLWQQRSLGRAESWRGAWRWSAHYQGQWLGTRDPLRLWDVMNRT